MLLSQKNRNCRIENLTFKWVVGGASLFVLSVANTGCLSRVFEGEENAQEAEQGDAETSAAVAIGQGPQVTGEWTKVPEPPAAAKDVNPIHSVMLPSGKILMVGGSSNRNYASELGIEVSDASRLKLVDNAAVFDPVNLTWQRIPGIPASVRTNFAAVKNIGVDTFCSGHTLTHDGRVIFAGGTLSYKSNFQGARLLWSYDERTNAWSELPPLGDGKWYPTTLTLADGKIAIISGLNGGASRTISNILDIFDPKTNKVQSVNLTKAPGFPYGGGKLLDHYPRILPLPNGKFLVTGDGTGIGPVNRKDTSFMTITPAGAVSFSPGPARSLGKRLYGTALVDPNSASGDILLIGGVAGVGDAGVVTPKSTPNTPTVRAMERYDVAANRWTVEPNFLGATAADSRTGLYATILPTGQFLAINGSNYIQNRGTYNPILYTPNGAQKYSSTVMKRAEFPRFYHNVALLLPDGRVWVNGSNRDRARVNADGTVTQANVPPGAGSDPNVAQTDGAWLKAGTRIATEFTTVEIFSPPYLFDASGKRIPENQRPRISNSPATITIGQKNAAMDVAGSGPGGKVSLVRYGSATHAWDIGQKFVPIAVAHKDNNKVELVLPVNAAVMPPGYYHLFYVSKEGVPSIGKSLVVKPQ